MDSAQEILERLMTMFETKTWPKERIMYGENQDHGIGNEDDTYGQGYDAGRAGAFAEVWKMIGMEE